MAVFVLERGILKGFFSAKLGALRKASPFHWRLKFGENEVELLCRQKCHVVAVYTSVCIGCPSSEKVEMDARGHLVAVYLSQIATGHGCPLLQQRPSCYICCQIDI